MMATKKTAKKATTKTAQTKKPAVKAVKITKKCDYVPRTYKKGLIFVLIGILGLVLIGGYFFSVCKK